MALLQQIEEGSNFSPISSRVISEQPMPKKYFMISRSRSVRVSSARSTSVDSDSLMRPRSALGESVLTSTSSRLLSSPSAKGASTEMWRPATRSVSDTFSLGSDSSLASSSGDGVRSCSCSKRAKALFILFSEPTWFRGRRTIRDCSARACRIDWRIHHTAYEMNLKPRVSSNFSAALMRPRLPSLMRSGRLSPWFWYCLATDTTKRRLAFVNLSNAS